MPPRVYQQQELEAVLERLIQAQDLRALKKAERRYASALARYRSDDHRNPDRAAMYEALAQRARDAIHDLRRRALEAQEGAIQSQRVGRCPDASKRVQRPPIALDRSSRLQRLAELLAQRHSRAELVGIWRRDYDLDGDHLNKDIDDVVGRWLDEPQSSAPDGFERSVRSLMAVIRAAWRVNDLALVLKGEIALAKLLGYLDGDVPKMATVKQNEARRLSDEELQALVAASLTKPNVKCTGQLRSPLSEGSSPCT